MARVHNNYIYYVLLVMAHVVYNQIVHAWAICNGFQKQAIRK